MKISGGRFGVLASAAVLVVTLALMCATPRTPVSKEVNRKSAAFLEQLGPTPNYALNPTAAQQLDAANVTYVGGVLTSNQTWSPSGGVYVVQSSVDVPSGITLTINAGTVIKVQDNRDGIHMLHGTLKVNGTSANPVVITSWRDDSVGGDTNEDGPSYGSWNDYGGAIAGSGNVTVKFSILRYGTLAISQTCDSPGSQLLATDNVFNSQVYVVSCGLARTTLNRNQFGVVAQSALYAYQSEVSGISMVGSNKNSFLLPDQGQAFELNQSYVSQGASWTVAPGQVLVPANFEVDGTMTLYGGTLIKMHPNTTGIQVAATGTFNASGTSTATVDFTSIRDDTMGGDTDGDGETYGSLHDYGSAVNTGGTSKFVKTTTRYGSSGISASCYNGQTQSFIANNNTFYSPMLVYACPNGIAAVDRNVFNVQSDYALQVVTSDTSKILLGGANRNTFTGADKGRAAYLNNAYVPVGASWSIDGNGGQTVVTSGLDVAGALTIGPGSIIKTEANTTGIFVEQSGTLQVTGNSGSRAIFTSMRDDTVGGDSGGDGPTTGVPGEFSEGIHANGIVTVQYANMRNMSTSISAYCPDGLSSLTVTDTYLRSVLTYNSCGQGKVSLKRNSFTIDRGSAVAVSNSSLDGLTLTGADRNVFNGSGARAKAIEIFNSMVPAGTTWDLTASGGAQPVVNGLQVQGTLNIAAGTVIKVGLNANGIMAGAGGTVHVNGTSSQRVTFTSIKDDAVNGDTGGDGATVAAPGDSSEALQIGAALDVHYAAFRNFSVAIDANCASPVTTAFSVADNIFNSPVTTYGCIGGASPDLKRNQFATGTFSTPLFINNSELSGVVMAGADANTFSGTGPQKVLNVYSGVVSAGNTWEMTAAPGAVLLAQNMVVDGLAKIGAGVIVKAQSASNIGITVNHGGTLQATGTAVTPVIFTSVKDDATGGDSGGDGATTAGPRDAVAIRSYGTVTANFTTFKNLYPAIDVSCDGSPGTHLELTDSAMRSSVNITGCQTGVAVIKRNAFNVVLGPAINTFGSEVSGITMTGADKNTFAGGGQKQALWLNSSYVDNGRTWDVDGTSGATLAVGAFYNDGRINMGPGLIVKSFTNYPGMQVGSAGVLRVDGTAAAPVIFTSLKDDTVGGDTGGDGPTTGALRDGQGIRAGGDTRIHHAVFRNNSPAVLTTCVNTPIATYFELTDSQINSNVSIENCPAGKVVLQRNQFASPFGMPLTVTNSEVSGISMDGANKNTFSGSDQKRVVYFNGGTLNAGNSWGLSAATGAVYAVGSMTVDGDLAVQPGVVIKIPYHDAGFYVSETSHLTMNGTSGAPITITGIRDDTVAGDSNGDKAATAPAKGDYLYGVYASGVSDGSTNLEIESNYTTVKYPALAFQLLFQKGAALQNMSIQQAQVGIHIEHGQALYRGTFSGTDRGVEACAWGMLPGCSVDASYTDWGNASGPLSCGAVLTDHWKFGGTVHDFSIFGSPNCDGSDYTPAAQLDQSAAAYSNSLAPWEIDCGNGFENACDIIQTTQQCFAAARNLAISNSTFPIDPDDLAGSTIEFGADTYVDSIADEFPSFANRYHAATGILQVAGIFSSLWSAYDQCHAPSHG